MDDGFHTFRMKADMSNCQDIEPSGTQERAAGLDVVRDYHSEMMDDGYEMAITKA